MRRPSFKATLASVDKAAAEALPGVTVVRDGDFLGVAAKDRATAARAAAAIKATWNEVPGQPSSETLFEFLRKNATPGEQGTVKGSVEDAMKSADVKLETTYTVAYIAHVPLETRSAVAEWTGDKLTVWTGSQRPFAVKDELAEAFHIPAEKVRVVVLDTGSGYGGKHAGDAAVEAARLAKAAGRPVKVSWSREEELTWAYFRPAGVIDVKSGARRDGTLTAWEFHNFNSGPAAIARRTRSRTRRSSSTPWPSPLRQGSYRGLAATANRLRARDAHGRAGARAFTRPARLPPEEPDRARGSRPSSRRRRRSSSGERRSRRRSAASASRAGRTRAASSGRAPRSRSTRRRAACASAASSSRSSAAPSSTRTASTTRSKAPIVQSIGGALFEAVRFENGRIQSAHLSKYRVPRFADVPEIEIVVLDRKDLPSAGAGETPIVGFAPAVGNAIFAATGVRLRALPLVPQGVVPAAS